MPCPLAHSSKSTIFAPLNWREVDVVVPEDAEPGDLLGFRVERGSCGLELCLIEKPPGSHMKACMMLGPLPRAGIVQKTLAGGLVVQKRDEQSFHELLDGLLPATTIQALLLAYAELPPDSLPEHVVGCGRMQYPIIACASPLELRWPQLRTPIPVSLHPCHSPLIQPTHLVRRMGRTDRSRQDGPQIEEDTSDAENHTIHIEGAHVSSPNPRQCAPPARTTA